MMRDTSRLAAAHFEGLVQGGALGLPSPPRTPSTSASLLGAGAGAGTSAAGSFSSVGAGRATDTVWRSAGRSTLLSRLPSTLYNSRRLQPSDKLDSSPLKLVFAVSDEFCDAVRVSADAALESGRATDRAAAVQAVLGDLVTLQIVFFDMSVPRMFVQSEDGSSSVMEAIDMPETVLQLDEVRRVLTVHMERKMPISSNFGGAPFRFVFVLSKDVIVTKAIFMLSKQREATVAPKTRNPPAVTPLSDKRQTALALAQTVCPVFDWAVTSGLAFCPSDVVEPPTNPVVIPKRRVVKARGKKKATTAGSRRTATGGSSARHPAKKRDSSPTAAVAAAEEVVIPVAPSAPAGPSMKRVRTSTAMYAPSDVGAVEPMSGLHTDDLRDLLSEPCVSVGSASTTPASPLLVAGVEPLTADDTDFLSSFDLDVDLLMGR